MPNCQPPKLALVKPNILLEKDSESGSTVGDVWIKNITSPSKPVAFKIKTTAPHKFTVWPNIGVIEGSGAVCMPRVTVKSEVPIEDACKERFLVEAVLVPQKLLGEHCGGAQRLGRTSQKAWNQILAGHDETPTIEACKVSVVADPKLLKSQLCSKGSSKCQAEVEALQGAVHCCSTREIVCCGICKQREGRTLKYKEAGQTKSPCQSKETSTNTVVIPTPTSQTTVQFEVAPTSEGSEASESLVFESGFSELEDDAVELVAPRDMDDLHINESREAPKVLQYAAGTQTPSWAVEKYTWAAVAASSDVETAQTYQKLAELEVRIAEITLELDGHFETLNRTLQILFVLVLVLLVAMFLHDSENHWAQLILVKLEALKQNVAEVELPSMSFLAPLSRTKNCETGTKAASGSGYFQPPACDLFG